MTGAQEPCLSLQVSNGKISMYLCAVLYSIFTYYMFQRITKQVGILIYSL